MFIRVCCSHYRHDCFLSYVIHWSISLSSWCSDIKNRTNKGFRSFGMWWCVIGWVRSYFSEDCSAFIVTWSLMMKVLWSCETWNHSAYTAEHRRRFQWLETITEAQKTQTGQELEQQVSYRCMLDRLMHFWRCFIACGFLVTVFLEHYCVFCPLPKNAWVVCVNYWLTSIHHWAKVLNSSACH